VKLLNTMSKKSEYRIRTAVGRYVIDRLLTDDKGECVVDFKTSRHLGANVEAFLDQERKRYTVLPTRCQWRGMPQPVLPLPLWLAILVEALAEPREDFR
jgi:hypothetical protein